MLILAILITIVAILFGIVFFYHWRKFAMNKTISTITLIAYFVGLIPILILLISSAIAMSK